MNSNLKIYLGKEFPLVKHLTPSGVCKGRGPLHSYTPHLTTHF